MLDVFVARTEARPIRGNLRGRIIPTLSQRRGDLTGTAFNPESSSLRALRVARPTRVPRPLRWPWECPLAAGHIRPPHRACRIPKTLARGTQHAHTLPRGRPGGARTRLPGT